MIRTVNSDVNTLDFSTRRFFEYITSFVFFGQIADVQPEIQVWSLCHMKSGKAIWCSVGYSCESAVEHHNEGTSARAVENLRMPHKYGRAGIDRVGFDSDVQRVTR